MDEITKKRKENMLDEISEVLYAMNKQTDALVDWYKKYEGMELLETEDGQKLRKCISEICCNHAYAFLHLSNIEFTDLKENYPDVYPDIVTEMVEKIANKTTL